MIEFMRLLDKWEVAAALHHNFGRLLYACMQGFCCLYVKWMILIRNDDKGRNVNLVQSADGVGSNSGREVWREPTEVSSVPNIMENFISRFFFTQGRKEVLPIMIRDERFDSFLTPF